MELRCVSEATKWFVKPFEFRSTSVWFVIWHVPECVEVFRVPDFSKNLSEGFVFFLQSCDKSYKLVPIITKYWNNLCKEQGVSFQTSKSTNIAAWYCCQVFGSLTITVEGCKNNSKKKKNRTKWGLYSFNIS